MNKELNKQEIEEMKQKKSSNMSEKEKSPAENERYQKENKYWFLREGDFRPEQAKNFNAGKGITSKLDIKLLKEAGNLFPSKEEASIASEKVREFICSINNPWCL